MWQLIHFSCELVKAAFFRQKVAGSMVFALQSRAICPQVYRWIIRLWFRMILDPLYTICAWLVGQPEQWKAWPGLVYSVTAAAAACRKPMWFLSPVKSLQASLCVVKQQNKDFVFARNRGTKSVFRFCHWLLFFLSCSRTDSFDSWVVEQWTCLMPSMWCNLFSSSLLFLLFACFSVS